MLPELDDDFASEASEFDTLEELRADIGERLAEAVGERIEQDFRVAAVDAAVDDAKRRDARRARHAPAPTSAGSGSSASSPRAAWTPPPTCRCRAKRREELIEESKPDAERELRREAVLAAIAEAEGIEVAEEEMVEALAHSAEHERTTPEKLLERLRENGRDALVRDDIRVRKAIDLVAEAAKPIAMEQAEAREKLWTPEKERRGGGLALDSRLRTEPGRARLAPSIECGP